VSNDPFLPATVFSRRTFLKSTAIVTTGAVFGGFEHITQAAASPAAKLTVADLPRGKAPRALPVDHFPSRLHAFVWRNWPLVPVDRMARVVGASPADLRRVARSMGLPRQPRIDASLETRWYISVIKRNWHLLPYEQLLQLLDWSPEKLAYTLREDDFLYVKLGNLKPACEPLRYEPISDVVRKRETWMRKTMESELPDFDKAPQEPLFGFLEELSRPVEGNSTPRSGGALKFCYSYFALYGDPLLETQADSYPPGYLARLAEIGVSGVWLHAVLYKLAPFPWDPSLSEGYQTRLKNLVKLVDRFAQHGLKLFMYLNEPRAMPLRFFEKQPDLKGSIEGDHAALCTTEPLVQKYVSDSIETICRAVPGIGGFFTITGSENLTHCWSHGGGASCPRCSKRQPAEVTAEASELVWRGIKASGSKARLIVWDWGWNDAWAPEAIRRLPEGVSFMSVSEWRLPLSRGGVKTEVGEYSISAIGPGPRATAHWRVARERGLSIVAKIQAGNTWELSSVPYIPALNNVAQHVENLRKAGIEHLMLGWTLGGCPSPNLEVASEVLDGRSAPQAIEAVAARRFGPHLAPLVVNAWGRLSSAFSEFPYHGGVVYNAPQQLGPANLLWLKPTGYAATMVGFPYDDLDAWRAVYPADVFVAQLEKVAEGFEQALQELRTAAVGSAKRASREQRRAFERECGVAEAAGIQFRSSANQVRFVLARRAWLSSTGADRAAQREALRSLLRAELGLAQRLHRLQRADSRLGYEASNHYFFIPADLGEKALNCRYLLAELEEPARQQP